MLTEVNVKIKFQSFYVGAEESRLTDFGSRNKCSSHRAYGNLMVGISSRSVCKKLKTILIGVHFSNY
jgi:hypothetical protein